MAIYQKTVEIVNVKNSRGKVLLLLRDRGFQGDNANFAIRYF
jgi:hypothetical protein